MQEETSNLSIKIGHLPDLSPEYKRLVDESISAQKKAHANYSHFKVGASVLFSNGEIVTGNNQENRAYPSGLCAERVAIYAAVSQYPEETVKAIAIYAEPINEEQTITPCGACRQVLMEYEHLQRKDIEVIMPNKHGKIMVSPSVLNLMPFPFVSDRLDGRHD